MAYQVLMGAVALAVGAVPRVLVSKPEADKREGTAPEAAKRGDGEARSQRTRRTARGVSRAGLDRRNPESSMAGSTRHRISSAPTRSRANYRNLSS